MECTDHPRIFNFSVVSNVGIVSPELKLKGCCKSGLVQHDQISTEGLQRWFCGVLELWQTAEEAVSNSHMCPSCKPDSLLRCHSPSEPSDRVMELKSGCVMHPYLLLLGCGGVPSWAVLALPALSELRLRPQDRDSFWIYTGTLLWRVGSVSTSTFPLTCSKYTGTNLPQKGESLLMPFE